MFRYSRDRVRPDHVWVVETAMALGTKTPINRVSKTEIAYERIGGLRQHFSRNRDHGATANRGDMLSF